MRRCTGLVVFVLWLLCAPNSHATDIPGTGELYLEVSLNGQATNLISSFVERSGRLFIRIQDLNALGIVTAPGRATTGVAAGLVDLTSVSGLSYRFDRSHQTIDLTVADGLRTPYQLGSVPPSPKASVSGTGLVFNYDAYAQAAAAADSLPALEVSSEQRLFSPVGVLDNTGAATIQNTAQRYVRLTTTWQYDDPASLRTFLLGDTVSSSLSWTRSVRLGGFQVQSDFALAPNLITFPVPGITGTAALPSTVDLYVNNVHEFTGDVPSGPFVISGAPQITGAGLATVVVRDPLGRSVTASLPVYIDTRLLNAGLSSYSLEGGLLRYGYGEDSLDYRGNPAFSASLRHGVNDEFTAEAHLESTSNLVVPGLGGLVRLGSAGVLNASMSGSAGPSSGGGQFAMGYQVIRTAFSVTLEAVRTLGTYRDLAAVGGTSPPRLLDQITASVPLPPDSTLGVSFIHVDDTVAGRSAVAAILYSTRLSDRISTFMNVSKDVARGHSLGVWIGLSFALGYHTDGYADAGTSNGHPLFGVGATRNADYDGGWEWQAQVNQGDSLSSATARLGYLGQYGEVIGSAQRDGQNSDLSLEAVGGVVFMDGVFEASRRINSGFALVATDGTAGIPVLHENRVIGTTDGSGHLLVPDLNPYGDNHLAIDVLGLPADAKVPIDRLDLTPRGGSGVLAHFPIEHYRAAVIAILDSAGKALPAGTAVLHRESGRTFTVGYEGQAFIEDLQLHNHLQVRAPGLNCIAEFTFNQATQKPGRFATLGTITCRDDGGLEP